MRQVRQSVAICSTGGRRSPQLRHTAPLAGTNSAQQASQIGTEVNRGRGLPQRAQGEGNRAQPRASTGLRSTRTTARQPACGDGGNSIMRELESLRKTHLTRDRRRKLHVVTPPVYALNSARRARSCGFHPAQSHFQHACPCAPDRFSREKDKNGPSHESPLPLVRQEVPAQRQEHCAKKRPPCTLRPDGSFPTSIRKRPAPRAKASAPDNRNAPEPCRPRRGG